MEKDEGEGFPPKKLQSGNITTGIGTSDFPQRKLARQLDFTAISGGSTGVVLPDNLQQRLHIQPQQQTQSLPQAQSQPLTQPLISRSLPIIRSESPRSSARPNTDAKDGTPKKTRQCNCKNSRCLKLYCECFASGVYCDGCNCINCCNNVGNEAARHEAIEATLDRNPNAFRPKIESSPHGAREDREGEQGRLPVLILSLRESKQDKRPAIVFLHSTHKCKEWLRPLLEAYASRGYITIAIDSRYHGERAKTMTTYREALVQSWRNGDTMPFIFDTVWDLIKLADYLNTREDIDPSRIGITGESLGGMHAWLAAAVDTRYSVIVPIIGVQGFRWAVDNDKWQARVDSIKAVFAETASDLGKDNIDKEVVEKVWDRIAPGLASQFDAPYTVPALAPRPVLLLNGADDPRCPVEGLATPVLNAREAYKAAKCQEKFEFIAQPGIGHQMTALMVKEASDWFDKFLKP